MLSDREVWFLLKFGCYKIGDLCNLVNVIYIALNLNLLNND